MWEFICSRCAYRVEQSEIISIPCPECQGTSWLCHLISQDDQNRLSVNNVTHSTKRTESTRKAVTKRTNSKHYQGRPQAVLPMSKIVEMNAEGMTLRDIAGELGVSAMTIQRALKKAKTRQN